MFCQPKDWWEQSLPNTCVVKPFLFAFQFPPLLFFHPLFLSTFPFYLFSALATPNFVNYGSRSAKRYETTAAFVDTMDFMVCGSRKKNRPNLRCREIPIEKSCVVNRALESKSRWSAHKSSLYDIGTAAVQLVWGWYMSPLGKDLWAGESQLLVVPIGSRENIWVLKITYVCEAFEGIDREHHLSGTLSDSEQRDRL